MIPPADEEPEDLGIKIGNADEVFWTGVQKKAEEMKLQCEREIVIQDHIHVLATARIKAAQEEIQNP